MKSINILFFVSIVTGWSGCYCQSGGLVGDLDDNIIADIFSILVTGTVHVVGNCSNDIEATQIDYWLYTQENPNNPTKLESFDPINKSKKIVFLLHGWGGSRDVNYIQVIKNGYLPKRDNNIIVVDYGFYVKDDYFTSYCNVPLVASALAKYICNLCISLNISPNDIHVVGHSLGAQVSGIAGNRTTCGKIGRITGLDPAGPLYQGIAPKDRLDSRDAVFVDVIHTDESKFGYTGDCGHVDFYPNCGFYQPNCLNASIIAALTDISDIVDLPLDLVRCNHQRSCSLFGETITYNNFPARPCPVGCNLPSTPVCLPNMLGTEVYMGEYLRSEPKNPRYTLATKQNSPYGYGPSGPMD